MGVEFLTEVALGGPSQKSSNSPAEIWRILAQRIQRNLPGYYFISRKNETKQTKWRWSKIGPGGWSHSGP